MINYIILASLQLLTLITTVSDWRTLYFREYPYLYAYEGDLNYENEYTKAYLSSEKSSLAAAYDNKKLIGFLTGIPLTDDVDFANASLVFEDANLNAKEFYYFGEIIVLPEYRKKGIASKLFALLEQKAQEIGYNKFCFITIEHPQNHPMKPSNYNDPSSLWKYLGYQKTSIKINAVYPTINSDGKISNTENILVFWTKIIDVKNT